MSERSRRPLIGVTGPDEGGAAAWWLTRFALWRAGGRARRITPRRPLSGDTEEALGGLDGLVLGGGADVDPALYGRESPSMAEALRPEGSNRGERLRRWTRRLVAVLTLGLRKLLARRRGAPSRDPARDTLELRLLRRAVATGKPVLGICRGAQLLNVHFGGTLHRDLEGFYEETPQVWTVRPRKRIEVEAGTLLADVLGTEPCRVNSLHRQAVERPADPLRVSARETNGVVQAVEHPDHPFLLGVQWHPEYLPQIRRQLRLFERLVTAARSGRAGSSAPSRPGPPGHSAG